MSKFCINIEGFENNEYKLTLNEIKYLKIIFKGYEEKKEVTLSIISKLKGIRPSSAIDTINNLIKKGFIKKNNKNIELTEKGLKLMKFITMKRRILELYFFYILDLDIKTAKKEAEKIDYIIGCSTIEKMVEKLKKRKLNLEKCLHEKETYIKEFLRI